MPRGELPLDEEAVPLSIMPLLKERVYLTNPEIVLASEEFQEIRRCAWAIGLGRAGRLDEPVKEL